MPIVELDCANNPSGEDFKDKVNELVVEVNDLRSDLTTAETAINTKKAKFTYSTSEQDTGDKWIDNKVIYCKVVDLGTFAMGNASKTVAHGITGLTRILPMTCMNGVAAGSYININYADNNSELYFLINGTNIILYRGESGDADVSGIYAVLYYTK